MDKIEIGSKLRTLRENTGMNAKEVSETLLKRFQIKVEYKSIYNYEKGRNQPDIDVFLALCIIYNCDDVLFEFGYTDKRRSRTLSEADRVAVEYKKLPESGKDVIRNALGIEKGENADIEQIS